MEEYRILKMHKRGNGITVETGTVFQFPTHMHSYYEMTLYEPFPGTISVNDNVFSIDRPTAILIIPSDFHHNQIIGTPQARYIKIAFESELLDASVPDCSLVLRSTTDDDFFIHLFREIAKEQLQPTYRKHLVCCAVLALLEKGARILPSKNTGSYLLAKKAVSMIHENFSQNITLTSVAQALSVSPQYLSCIFKETIGINFSAFLSGVRLRRASKLLTETQDSVTHICEMCGYRNFSHFLRSFKNMFGHSPSVYRKKHSK